MTDYVKLTDFAAKDSLASGNPSKIVKGTEIDDEFAEIALHISTKVDAASGTFTGVPTAPTAAATTTTTQIATCSFVHAVVDAELPVGFVQLSAFSTPPTGYLACDGTAISRAGYADLFAAIGETYGVGDGSTTFNLPDVTAPTSMTYMIKY
jgi:hypothetical protein